MAWFTCMAGVGGKGNSVIVTCDADFAGVPITCTNGQKTYTKVCPSFSPYEVTFTGLVAGTWTISATVDGVVYSTTAIVTDITAVLSYGFNWKMWVDSSSSLHSSDYTDLADLLSDEAAIRQLFTEHAPTDYAASTATVTPDLATVLNNDLCAKWINLRDYALDTLYANPLIAAAMDSADKYFYGEWGIVDDTTTPPTWGALGNVPVMTANNAPYGEAFAKSSWDSDWYPWKAFDGNINQDDAWATAINDITTQYIGYRSVNPICVKRVSVRFTNLHTYWRSYTLQGSNDNNTWSDIGSTTISEGVSSLEFDVTNSDYYLYHRLYLSDVYQYTSSDNNIRIVNLQFYGRELSVSVPVMTSNTTPYGEVVYSSQYGTSPYYSWQAFDQSALSADHAWLSEPGKTVGEYIGYDFKNSIAVKMVVLRSVNNQNYHVVSAQLQGYSSGEWHDIQIINEVSATPAAITVADIINTNGYEKYRLVVLSVNSGGYCGYGAIQFYGVDYSEKEFEEGTTKKWLYDHGVELETITISGAGTKGTDAIQLTAANAQATASVDTTAYSLMRGKVGAHASGTNQLICGSGASNFTANNMPYNNGFDVSSVNGSNAVGVKQTANGIFDATEFWLE